MQIKILTRLRQLHLRLDHDVRAEAARRVPDPARLARLKKLKLAIKDRLGPLERRFRLTPQAC